MSENQYTPWVEKGMTELEYFKALYLAERQAAGTFENIAEENARLKKEIAYWNTKQAEWECVGKMQEEIEKLKQEIDFFTSKGGGSGRRDMAIFRGLRAERDQLKAEVERASTQMSDYMRVLNEVRDDRDQLAERVRLMTQTLEALSATIQEDDCRADEDCEHCYRLSRICAALESARAVGGEK